MRDSNIKSWKGQHSIRAEKNPQFHSFTHGGGIQSHQSSLCDAFWKVEGNCRIPKETNYHLENNNDHQVKILFRVPNNSIQLYLYIFINQVTEKCLWCTVTNQKPARPQKQSTNLTIKSKLQGQMHLQC